MRPRPFHEIPLLGFLAALSACACGSGAGPRFETGHGGEREPAVDTPLPAGVDPVPESCGARSLPEQPLRRLSSLQYENTLRALFGATLAPALLAGSRFPPTQISAGFSGDAEPNIVSSAESSAIEDEERIAQLMLESPGPYLLTLLPCDISEPISEEAVDACLPEFIAAFGQRAYRRPLSDTERALAQRVYDELRGEQGAIPAWSAVVQFFLQAPALLYRVEHGAGPLCLS